MAVANIQEVLSSRNSGEKLLELNETKINVQPLMVGSAFSLRPPTQPLCDTLGGSPSSYC